MASITTGNWLGTDYLLELMITPHNKAQYRDHLKYPLRPLEWLFHDYQQPQKVTSCIHSLHEKPPHTQYDGSCASANAPMIVSNTQKCASPGSTYMSHCSVENLTCSNLSRRAAVSCSIRVSTSLSLRSCELASSRIRPFSRFRSKRTDACVR